MTPAGSRLRLAVVALSAALSLALPACGGGDSAGPQQTGPPVSLVAQSKIPSIPVFEAPGASAPKMSLSNPNEDGAPRVFLVKSAQSGWLEVLLPVRPNGSRGWIREEDVTIAKNPFRVKVELNADRLRAWNGDTVIAQEPVGVGRANTPTPGGEYYITELLQPPNPNRLYGPYAFGLSGFSNVLESFAGGAGVVGLHGTDNPAALGQDVSAGCIRMNNEAITRLAKLLPLGTPVEIVA